MEETQAIDAAKAAAAEKSLEFVQSGMTLGLGTGSTATHVITLLGERVRHGLHVRGVPTSQASAQLASRHGIPLLTLDQVSELDLTIDGADEVDPGRNLIKGGGGALLHEKIVASSSRRLIIVADGRKLVPRLGRFPLPVEVIPFARMPVERRLAAMGANPVLRLLPNGAPFRTDEGNVLYDCGFGQIDDAHALARTLKSIVGVVEHGLFLEFAPTVIIADADGVRVLGKNGL